MGIEQRFIIRGNSQATSFSLIETPFETSDDCYPVGIEVQKLNGRTGGGAGNEINPAVDKGHIEVTAQALQYPSGRAALHGDSPQTGVGESFGVVEEFAVRRFAWPEPAISRHLNRIAAARGHLPHLLLSRTGGVKVDPPAVTRPTGVA